MATATTAPASATGPGTLLPHHDLPRDCNGNGICNSFTCVTSNPYIGENIKACPDRSARAAAAMAVLRAGVP